MCIVSRNPLCIMVMLFYAVWKKLSAMWMVLFLGVDKMSSNALLSESHTHTQSKTEPERAKRKKNLKSKPKFWHETNRKNKIQKKNRDWTRNTKSFEQRVEPFYRKNVVLIFSFCMYVRFSCFGCCVYTDCSVVWC